MSGPFDASLFPGVARVPPSRESDEVEELLACRVVGVGVEPGMGEFVEQELLVTCGPGLTCLVETDVVGGAAQGDVLTSGAKSSTFTSQGAATSPLPGRSSRRCWSIVTVPRK